MPHLTPRDVLIVEDRLRAAYRVLRDRRELLQALHCAIAQSLDSEEWAGDALELYSEVARDTYITCRSVWLLLAETEQVAPFDGDW